MINFKTGALSKKEMNFIKSVLVECDDIYGDAYITKNNLRLFIKENTNIVFDCIKNGDKIIFCEDGIALIVGYSDKAVRKYLKILTKNEKTVKDIIKILSWNIQEDIYVKLKKNNPLRNVLEKNYFRFAGSRGKEILLVNRRRKNVKQASHKS